MRELILRSVLLLTVFSHTALAWTSTLGLPLSLRRFSSHHSCCASASPVRGGTSSSSSSSCSTSTHLATRPRGLNGRQVPTCKLERLPRRTLKRAVPIRPTAERWIAYFGQTATERRRKVVDALAVAFVFYWSAFFASRTLLGALAWRAFYLVVFIQGFLRPLLESRSRALELWGEGNNEARSKTKGALFTGRVTQTGFALASEASDHRTHFQMLVEDEEGRELLFDVPQVAEYRDVRKGMRCEVVVLTRSADFSELTGITEAYLPELEMFVGRFPFLDKRVFGELLDSRDERDRRGGGTPAALPALPTREQRPGQDGRRGVRSSRGDDGVGRGTDLDVSQFRRQQERGSRERAMAVEGNEKGGMVSRRARTR